MPKPAGLRRPRSGARTSMWWPMPPWRSAAHPPGESLPPSMPRRSLMSREPRMSVVICSLNGADGVDRCLSALARQTIATDLEVILVDDGSSDGTSDVGHRHGARVIRHSTNRGLAAARNPGVRATTAPVVGFLDDDTEPHSDWAERLLSAYGPGVAGVGGVVESEPGTGLLA